MGEMVLQAILEEKENMKEGIQYGRNKSALMEEAVGAIGKLFDENMRPGGNGGTIYKGEELDF